MVAFSLCYLFLFIYLFIIYYLLFIFAGDVEAFKEIKETLIKESSFRVGARDSTPSMLQDIQKKRRTEIDYLNGYPPLFIYLLFIYIFICLFIYLM